MQQNIQISEVITVDSEENRCALAFSLDLHHQFLQEKMLFLTANNYALVYENLEEVKRHLPFFEEVHQRIEYLFLKEPWESLDKKYGTLAFMNELSHLVEQEEFSTFYLHRIDLFFDKIFTQKIQESLIAFIEAVRYHQKKVIISYNTKTVSGQSFDALFASRRDLSFLLNAKDDQSCYHQMQVHNKLLKKERVTIALISNQEEIVQMHQRIFANQKGIVFKHVKLEDFQKKPLPINEEVDLIIYNESRKELDETMIKVFQNLAPDSKIVLISTKNFIRKSDIHTFHTLGIDQIYTYGFDVEDYLYDIEQTIHKTFYTQKLKTISFTDKEQIVSEKELIQRIQELEEKQIYFSMVTLKLDKTAQEDLTKLIRRQDFIFIDQQHQIVLFVLLNIVPSLAQELIAKRLKSDPIHIKEHSHHTIKSLVS